MSRFRVNGETRTLEVTTVVELLSAEEIDLDARFLAVAVNGVVVPRGHWDNSSLQDGDDIEIVRPAPGG